MKSTIDPEQYYSIRQISLGEFLPWMTSHYALTSYMKSERGHEVFKPLIKQTKRHRKYLIKGSVLIDVIDKASKGEIVL